MNLHLCSLETGAQAMPYSLPSKLKRNLYRTKLEVKKRLPRHDWIDLSGAFRCQSLNPIKHVCVQCGVILPATGKPIGSVWLNRNTSIYDKYVKDPPTISLTKECDIPFGCWRCSCLEFSEVLPSQDSGIQSHAMLRFPRLAPSGTTCPEGLTFKCRN